VNIRSTTDASQHVQAIHYVGCQVACSVCADNLHTAPMAAIYHCTCNVLTAVMLPMLCSLEEFIKYYERLAR
jgi:hypothetical protein